VTGGPAAQGAFNQNINTPGAPPNPANNTWAQQLEIWVTPWGFLKGAAANNATVQAQTIAGRRFNVVTWMAPIKSPGGQAYRVVGYINTQNLVERVETWLENPVLGDMHVEVLYSEYRDNNGLKYPATIVQKRDAAASSGWARSRTRSRGWAAASTTRRLVGEACRRRVSHYRRVCCAGRRVCRSHPRVRRCPPE
jgi:hypothetical protein